MGEKVIELRALESSLIFKFFYLSKSGTLKHLDTVIHVAVDLLCAHTHTHLTLDPPPDLMYALTFSL